MLINKMLKLINFFILFLIFYQNSLFAENLINDPLKSSNSSKEFERDFKCGKIKENNVKILDFDIIIKFALCNNPKLKESWNQFLIRKENLGAGRSQYLPKISATSNYVDFTNKLDFISQGNATGSTNTGISVINGTGTFNSNSIAMNYLLYDFGKRGSSIDYLKQDLASFGYKYNKDLQNFILDISRKYYTYFIMDKMLKAKIKSEELSKKVLDYAMAKLMIGKARKLDVLQAKSSYEKVKAERIRSEKGSFLAKIDILLDIGINPKSNININLSNESFIKEKNLNILNDIDKLLQISKEKNPKIKEAFAILEKENANVEMVKSSHYPVVNLFGQINKDNRLSGLTYNREYHAYGINAVIPIFSGFETFYKVKVAERERDVMKSRLEMIEIEIAKEIWQSYYSFETSKNDLIASEEYLKTATEAENLARESYKLGVLNIIDLISAQSQLVMSDEIYIASLFNYYITKIELLKNIGLLDI